MITQIRFPLFFVVVATTATCFGTTPPKEGGETPISEAIAAFNKKALSDAIGKGERPMTTEEAIAAIQLWERPADAPISDELFNQFKKIATTKTLPSNAKFESLNGLDAGGTHVFDIWSVRIRLDRADGSSYAFQLRQRVVASRTLVEELARLDGFIDTENVANWVGGHRILDRRKGLAARIMNQIEE